MPERPRHVAALLSALRFGDPHTESLCRLSNADWARLLLFAQRSHLSLLFADRCSEYLPDCVRERIARNRADNSERLALIQAAYRELARALRDAAADHLVLKGFAQFPCFVPQVDLRMQSDIDLYCPPDSLLRARDALFRIGYEYDRAPSHDRADHLPALVRLNGWRWRGNAFDPEMPPSVELHHRFWDRPRTRFGPVDLTSFWNRRVERRLGEYCFPTLQPLDAFAYSALHALRHFLYGGLLLSTVYELAFFLDRNFANDALWRSWLTCHDDALRSAVAIPALVARDWFEPRLPEAVAVEIACLPRIVPRWFEKFGEASSNHLSRGDKNALWLHLGLVDSLRDRARVSVNHLFPLWIPRLESRWVQEDHAVSPAPSSRPSPVSRYARYGRWFFARTLQHLRMLVPALWHGLRLWSS